MGSNFGEVIFRMALSRMEMSLGEIRRIREEIYDGGALDVAERHLEEAIEYLTLARDNAAGELGFTPKDSMPT